MSKILHEVPGAVKGFLDTTAGGPGTAGAALRVRASHASRILLE